MTPDTHLETATSKRLSSSKSNKLKTKIVRVKLIDQKLFYSKRSKKVAFDFWQSKISASLTDKLQQTIFVSVYFKENLKKTLSKIFNFKKLEKRVDRRVNSEASESNRGEP